MEASLSRELAPDKLKRVRQSVVIVATLVHVGTKDDDQEQFDRFEGQAPGHGVGGVGGVAGVFATSVRVWVPTKVPRIPRIAPSHVVNCA